MRSLSGSLRAVQTKWRGDGESMKNLYRRTIACAVLLGAAANGQTFATLWTFSGNYVFGSEASLVQGSDGNFYGTTNDGGTHGLGTVFKMTPAGALTTLYSFGSNAGDGAGPSPLVLGNDGNFYGTTQGNAQNVGTFFQVTTSGTLTTVYSFTFANLEGASPQGLIKGSDGNFYGMTNSGGANNGGTVFKMTPAGALSTIYAFNPSQTGANGLTGTLLQGTDGNFYGTMVGGGNYNSGQVFKVTPGGGLTILYAFGPLESNPGPPGALIQATDGNLYGVTNPGDSVSGTVYRITTGGTLTNLYFFQGSGNGANPTTLIQATDGNFYGLTAAAGSDNSGTVFKLTGGGTLTTVYNFEYLSDGADGIFLLEAPNGVFYGTTNQGGAHGLGTIFELTLPISPTTPAITSVANAFSNSATIAPNTWVAIKGVNLSPPGDSRTWLASDFVNGQMPTGLDSVSVSMNGEPAYVYYISPTQLNVLTPPDLAAGAVQVAVTNNGQVSAQFTAQAQSQSLAFFVFNGGPYVVATHVNGSDVGPSSLFPGLSTPASAGSYAVLYANGFGAVTPAVTKGSEVQTGSLPSTPVVQIGGTQAVVQYAGLVSPGLYQFNVVVPMNVASGDNTLVAQYNGQSTQSGVLLTVQNPNQLQLQSVAFSASSVVSGNTVQGTVTLTLPAPAGGISVTLTASSNAVALPATVQIAAGQTSATFVAAAEQVTSAQTVTITASYLGNSVLGSLTVNP